MWILHYLKNGRSEKGSFTMTTACPRAPSDEKNRGKTEENKLILAAEKQ